jgi:ribulose-5-phosphate 4-epimerase/fuculose-1-phosphate aldolase
MNWVKPAVGSTASPNMDPAEWEQRVNLAACYRLVDHFGWTDLIYTHISARVPGEPGHFLLNRFGLLFDEVAWEHRADRRDCRRDRP